MIKTFEHRLMRGRALIEIGWIHEAEREAACALVEMPDSLDALSMVAKIKHMKGELTEALACWAQIHARSPRHAFDQLPPGMLLHQGADSAPHPGSDHLAHATALLRERRPREALAWCDGVAATHRGRNANHYKMAAMRAAWIAEIGGDVEAARLRLEALGRDKGFEHDLDRLFALARVCVRIGAGEALASAARICRHVLADHEREGREQLSLLGHLAMVERRAGNLEVAVELDERFLRATRRRMHRATLHDLVRTAATDYLPISRLRAARPAETELPDGLLPRERAIAHAIRGEFQRARDILAPGDHWLDQQYLAELAALSDDPDRAIDLFLASLPDGLSLAVVGWLLDRYAFAPSPAIAHYWSDPWNRSRTIELLEGNIELAPRRAELWRWLGTLYSIAAMPEIAKPHTLRAQALTDGAAVPGRVLAAGVYRFGGKPKGLLHEIWVHRTPTTPGRGGHLPPEEIHGNVTTELRAAIRNAFVAVREYARAKWPERTHDLDDYIYSYKLPKEDEPSGGLSAGLPTALAFLSVFFQRPLSRTLASSGTLITESHDVISVGKIGDAEHKVKAAYHGNLRTLILPLANRSDLEPSPLVPLAITHEIVRYASNLDHAVTLAFGAGVFTRV